MKIRNLQSRCQAIFAPASVSWIHRRRCLRPEYDSSS